MTETILIIGAGQAGGEITAQLRTNGFIGNIILLGEEPELPYLRPPLSKAYLAGEIDGDALLLRNAPAYEKAGVTVRTGVKVDHLDRHARQATLDNGEVVAYDKLILATGGRPRQMKVPGATLENIFYLRRIADVDAIKPAFAPGRKLVIVGGGYIGLEVAAVAIKHGLDVTVLEGAPRVLARVTSPEMSAFYERIHTAQGVKIHTGVAVSDFAAKPGGNAVGTVVCGEDPPFAADLVIVGIGLLPNTELAETAGLVVDNGIVVNAVSQTSDPHIYAIGDCASHAHHGFLLRKIRLESVPNASEQARIAAADICGKPAPVTLPPWFWSDQYKLKLQMVGLSDGYDDLVIRGDIAGSSFITFYFKSGVIIAADAVNRIADFMLAKRLVQDRRKIPPALLADETRPLKETALAV